MKKLLWLDDFRNPFIDEEKKVPPKKWHTIEWVLNYEQFVEWITRFGLPDAVSFDHDLSSEHYTPEYFWDKPDENRKYQLWASERYKDKTGLDCAEWLINYCRKHGRQMPECFVHSANPIGKENIIKALENLC